MDIDIHCRQYGLTVVKEYQFDSISGAHVQQTKRFKEMLAMLSQPATAGLVFASLDRFFRPKKLSAYDVFGLFESTGKHLFCDLGELDSKNPQDQMKIVLWGQMGGMERLRIKDRVGKGKDIMRADTASKIDTLPNGVVHVRDNPKANAGHFEPVSAKPENSGTYLGLAGFARGQAHS
jgi:DNA invertase Pin-like site-specific DNA recombinase